MHRQPRNIAMTREGNKLVLEIDLSVELGPSSTGKSTLIASTSGNQPVPGVPGTMVGLTCFKYAERQ